jgi:hypothetical protein
LSNPSTGAILGNPKSATVNITGGATSTVGNVAFSAPSYAVNQADASGGPKSGPFDIEVSYTQIHPWSNVNLADYGPAPLVGKWATYKIPLSVLTIGSTHFTGSISGNTLTVSNVSSGVGMDAGGYVTGPGVPSGTYITAFGKPGGKAGTYTVAGPGINGSTSVPSAGMVEQRTGIYKFGLPDQGGSSNNHYYLDNIKFSVN